MFLHPTKKLYWHTLQHRFTSHFQARHRIHTIVILAITGIFFGAVFFLSRSIPSLPQVLGDASVAMPETLLENQSLGSAFPSTNNPIATPTPKNLVYSLIFSPKASASVSGFLADEIVAALSLSLQLGQPFPVQALARDTLQATPASMWEDTYYAVIENPNTLTVNRRYEASVATFLINSADSIFLPYLMNKSYCQTDADCFHRHSQCKDGSFNRFEPFIDGLSCQVQEVLVNATPSACTYISSCQSQKCHINLNCN